MKKELMLTNHAIARGAYEAGVRVVAAYPGTPSTEITEAFSQYRDVYSEWSPNEKVALEVGVGASFAGARSLVCMKHVGLNVAADPLFTTSYTGVNGGLVIAVADDPGMHSSQNEQDTRYYARSAHVLTLEPANAAEAKEFTALAFELSERYDTPVILRTTTRVSHSHGFVELKERADVPLKPYQKQPQKYIMMPSNAKGRHVEVEKRDKLLGKDVNGFEINRAEYNDKSIGIVCAGVVYEYVKEALPNASVFKVGTSYPLPINAISDFASKVKRLYVFEELEPYMEDALRAAGIACSGKELFSLQGELSVAKILEAFGAEAAAKPIDVPARPPLMCAGCPHRGVFYVLSKLKLTANGDIGCYTLGAVPPLSALDTMVCMGASISMAHGFKKALGNDYNNVAVIGDSTFIHSGITSLINSVYNQSSGVVLILDNSTTGMTGHQEHPATGKNLYGDTAPQLDLVALCRGCGVMRVDTVDAFDLKRIEALIKEGNASGELCVVIVKRPCVIIDRSEKPLYRIEDCKKCGICLGLGCPAISRVDGKAQIDSALCNGCGLCAGLCALKCIKRAVR